MKGSRFPLKVGLFVVVGAALVAALIITFSKGSTFASSYKLHVVLPNAAGLKVDADVMMAGVPIGTVNSIALSDDARSVDITIVVRSAYKIRKDADIHIDSLDFLGDQYLAVSAPALTGLMPTNQIEYFQSGDTVTGKATFNMTEAVRSISGVVDQANNLMKDLDKSVTNVNASALAPNTLGLVVSAVSNLEAVSRRASAAVGRVEDLLSNNAGPFDSAVDNFRSLSVRLTNSAAELDSILVDNKADIRRVVTNLTMASDQLRSLASDLQAGKGPAGELLKNEQMSAELSSMVSNAQALTAEFSAFGSNLNQKGIWAMLWKPKHPKKDPPPAHANRGGDDK